MASVPRLIRHASLLLSLALAGALAACKPDVAPPPPSTPTTATVGDAATPSAPHPIAMAARTASHGSRPTGLPDTRPALAFAAASDDGSNNDARNGSVGDVMLQGFHWTSSRSNNPGWYQIVQQNADTIKDAGFTLVWFPPPSKTADDQGYLPNEWNHLDTRYGSKQQLKDAIAALRPAKALADIVINHRTGTATAGADFTNPAFGDDDVNRGAVVSNDECGCGTGGNDSGTSIDPAGRDLNHDHPAVQREVKQWLRMLKDDVGFAGWRYDMVKGYNGRFVADYNDDSRPYFSVGECWDDERQVVAWWVDATRGKSTAFDFPTRTHLKEAVARREFGRLKTIDGKPTGLIGWWPQMSVTFIENHDTEADHFNVVFGDGDQVMQGYAYILTHPGIPCVFWTHYFDWGQDKQDRIKRLIRIRRESGIGRDSVVDIREADGGRYAAVIDGRVAVKIGPGPWDPGAGWTAATSGNDYAVWIRQ